jgi:hypothetical protein
MDRESKHGMLTLGKVVAGVVYAVVLSFVIILTLAFFLRLLGANPSADFAEWIYRSASRIMEPFRGIFPTTEISDRSVFDASLLFGIIMYSIFALAVHALVDWFARRLASLEHAAEQDRYLAALEKSSRVPGATDRTVPSTPVVSGTETN